MTAQIIQFRPKANPALDAARAAYEHGLGWPINVPRTKSDRAFWKGPDPLDCTATDIVNQIFPGEDTAPSEYVAPSYDGA